MMTLPSKKQQLREQFAQIRKGISDERRSFAKMALCDALYPLLGSKHVLSFTSFSMEIDTSALNARLASENRLSLLNLDAHYLDFFGTQYVLVPGLVFDTHNYRIGYGKGYYDRFIAAARQQSLSMRFIGIGFKEQLFEEALPCEPHDQPLDEVILL